MKETEGEGDWMRRGLKERGTEGEEEWRRRCLKENGTEGEGGEIDRH